MRILRVLLSLLPALALADEGMWLFNEFPKEQAKKAVGFSPDEKWLERVRLGSLRLANGCSASIVSKDGLVMTNHHCVRPCLEDLTSKERDLLSNPFVAKKREDELKCPKYEGNQLLKITDVTARVLSATEGASGADWQKKAKAETSKLESECAGGDANKRCDVVTLFHGAKFHLYEYRRFQDLRLVFAPEFQMAAFGGDPDNFNFPRYGFDAAFLRIYVDGKPAKTPDALKWARVPAKEGDVVFTSGHPGGTERSLTVAQYEFLRDVSLPWSIAFLSELRGRLDEWMKQSEDRQRNTRSRLRSVENSLKALKGRQQALVAPGFLTGKQLEEDRLRKAAPEATKSAWDEIANALLIQRTLYVDYVMREGAQAFQSDLFSHARRLARLPVETAKPNGERLREYTDAQLPAVKQQLLDAAPVQPELEKARLTWSLTKLREVYGADDPFVKKVLAGQSPEDLAAALIDGTKLNDAEIRKQILEGGAASDPMIDFARRVDGESRAVRKKWEDEVDAVVKKNGERLAEARRTVIGASGAPDATFTLRLSYGRIQGVGAPGEAQAPKAGAQSAKGEREASEAQPAMTRVKGLYERASGKHPFALAGTWLSAQKKLKPNTPYNVATTNDIIGGNSGSPLLDKNGDVVGLVFDGNLQSLGGNFGYEPNGNRAVAVHGDLILAALENVYGAGFLLAELKK